ncbi:type II toxin-antitoxin system RelE/ParE family toxin [Azospirillum sp. TSA2s]|uniref:type II toxin-antitoxin system RelE/ParE family toxin n=1 Tax=Azospirillum sp. TSA2s TaxID=709810 RepID=UPI0010AB3512|nr:type II toxin-antitoxin system RelE/ParE family toxin [Azospirillum sp. TSA2s]QCG97030.1 type II toxin-antitoxin system RelE/ParE family toxin [Azospirillum sp. TSA2s]
MQHYKLRYAPIVTQDFGLIEDHLFQSYQDLGDDAERATERAACRIVEAADYLRTFATYPHRGTEHPEIQPGIRTVTRNRFTFYFSIDDSQAEVLIVAVFFGGVDHRRQIVDRLGSR